MDESKFEASKVDKSKRTFETRVEFIRQVFTNKYSEEEIFKSCIEYKLSKSFEQYVDDINKCYERLRKKIVNNPAAVANKI